MSTTGVEFRAIRESRGLTVDRIASATRIPVRYIEALERDDVRALPARPYLRGFVAAYGRELGLDPADAVSRYFAQLGPPPPEPVMAADVPLMNRLLPRVGHRCAGARRPARHSGVQQMAIGRRAAAARGCRDDRDGAGAPAATGVAGRCGTRSDRPGRGRAESRRSRGLDDLRASLLARRFGDGTRIVYQTMEPGSTQVLKARREIAIRVGDAGAVAWTVNGRAQAPLGGPGEVRNVVLTPGGAPTIK